MEAEIIKMLNSVKKKINRSVAAYEVQGEGFYSTESGAERCEYQSAVYGVVSDGKSGKTYFSFKRDGKGYVGYIEGVTEQESTICALIATLLDDNSGEDVKECSLRDAIVEGASDDKLSKIISKYSIPELPCTVLAINVPGGKVDDVLNFMENFKTRDTDLCCNTESFLCAYVRFEYPDEEGEYRSAADFAGLLVQSIAEELGIAVRIGVGGEVGGFSSCFTSYKQATSALRMSAIYGTKSDVSTYKEYALIKVLEEMPRHKLVEFLDILEDSEAKGMLQDPEMISTAEEFLHTSLNVSETSRNLYMHRNTLMYRLDKIERTTGLDIRKFQDAMTFRLIMILHKILG